MKFGLLIEDNARKIFIQKPRRNEAEILVPHPSLFFKIASYKIKASDQHLSFNLIW